MLIEIDGNPTIFRSFRPLESDTRDTCRGTNYLILLSSHQHHPNFFIPARYALCIVELSSTAFGIHTKDLVYGHAQILTHERLKSASFGPPVNQISASVPPKISICDPHLAIKTSEKGGERGACENFKVARY